MATPGETENSTIRLTDWGLRTAVPRSSADRESTPSGGHLSAEPSFSLSLAGRKRISTSLGQASPCTHHKEWFSCKSMSSG